MHRLELRQRVPDLRRAHPLRRGGAEHRVVLAVRLGPGRHVIGPTHAGLVEQVGDVRPLVRRRVVGQLLLLVRLRVQVRPAQLNLVGDRTRCRPTRDHGQMGGEAPGLDRLEHVVLEDEVLGVCPVVRDLAGVVPSHGVGLPLPPHELRAVRAEGILPAEAVAPLQRAGHEPVHSAAVDVRHGVRVAVGTALVDQGWIVERRDAPADLWVGDAHGRPSVLHGDAIGAGIGPEVRVERPVLLHDHDHVSDRVDAAHRFGPALKMTLGHGRAGPGHDGEGGHEGETAEGSHGIRLSFD